MGLLNENVQKQVRQVFEGMLEPVKLVFFTQGEPPDEAPGVAGEVGPVFECSMCADTHTLLEEVTGLSDKIKLEVYDFIKDKAVADQYRVDKIPATVVLAGSENKDRGIRLYGIPSGYEFGTLIQDIVMASKGQPDLKAKTLEEVRKLNQPVHIQVFTTPT